MKSKGNEWTPPNSNFCVAHWTYLSSSPWSGVRFTGMPITSLICRQSEDALLVEEGTLYPALWRLENKGLLEAEWGLSENNRKAKFYRLTSEGPASTARRGEDLGGVRRGRGQGPGRNATSASGGDGMRPAPLWRRYDRLTGSDPAADVKDELRFHIEIEGR